ncbi:MAG TPA: amidohydrolase family protein [Candidatus Sulfotelmatobacter sp.]|jgi:imidazolonepropionase-like amidohydrolase|nr:amidohydrolase family protein [Candidatus Sulfotelmatobacter sp.]
MRKWFLLSCLLCLLPASAQQNNALAITHATVIDCTGAPPMPNSTVVIAGGHITSVGPSDRVSIPAGAHVVDGNGKFLIPGLWDMHGHLTDATEDAFPLLIMNGVTGVRDMGGDLAQIDRWRSEIEKGTRVGPHIVRAGPFVDGPKEGVTNRLTVRTPEEARQAVRDLKAKGVDFIKVHNALPPDAFFALMDEARKEHVPVAVHLPRGVSSAEASDAGVASLEHVETMSESALWQKGATAKTVEQAVDEILGPAGQKLFQIFVKNGTWYVPTLVAYERGFVLWSNDPESLKPRLDIHEKNIEIVRMMHKAGVPIMAGSDFSDWAMVPGIDLHNELALLVESGFSPLEALQTATLNPAKFLDKADTYGTIQVGRAADLVLLDMNPLEDISHTRKINAVVLGGKFYPLASIRARALQNAAKQ